MEYRRHDGVFDSADDYSVDAARDSLEYYACVGSGNADTTYYVQITSQRDHAAAGPSYTHTVRTMASGTANGPRRPR